MKIWGPSNKEVQDSQSRALNQARALLKDRNGMHLTEAEDIKKRWQEYTEELYKKDLHIPGCLDLGE